MAFLSASRSVLLLGDDGVSVYNVRSSSTEYIDTVLWDADGLEESLAALIRNRCGGKPVVIINDVVEQHYRKERISQASPLDRANLIKRKVASAFPSYPIRSAIKLKEKAPLVDGKKTGDIYLFSALPFTDNIRKALAGVRKSHASIAGFCLLPVEATSMVHTLSKKVSKGESQTSQWCIFVGQHQNGGLRQIVTKNGELALTRMTPISVDENNAEIWCSDVVGELKGTMSYLSRFGFTSNDGLRVILIAPSALSARLSSKIDFECDLNILTTREAANFLGIKLGGRGQDQQKLADLLHVSWIGKKSSFLMPLTAPQIENMNRPMQMATAASIALLVGSAFMGYQGVTKTASMVSLSGEIEQAKQDLQSAQAERDVEVEKKNQIGLDYMLVESATKVYNDLETQSMRPLAVFNQIGKSIGTDLHIKSMDVRPVEIPTDPATADPVADPNADAPDEKSAAKEFEIVIKLVFPPSVAPDLGVKKVGEIEQRLKKNLPTHKVSILKQVADLSYTGNFVGETTSTTQQEAEKKELEAEIMIRGALL